MDAYSINPVSILMFIFSAALLIYAGWLARSKDPRMIPRHYAAKMDHPERYAVQMAKAIAVVSAAPFLAGVVGVFSGIGCLIALIVGLVVTIWLSTKIMKNEIQS